MEFSFSAPAVRRESKEKPTNLQPNSEPPRKRFVTTSAEELRADTFLADVNRLPSYRSPMILDAKKPPTPQRPATERKSGEIKDELMTDEVRKKQTNSTQHTNRISFWILCMSPSIPLPVYHSIPLAIL